jgi:hypothetical protein
MRRPAPVSVPRVVPVASLLVALAAAFVAIPGVAADPPQPPRAGGAGPRSGTTNRFGSGTITRRSDGSSAQTRPFGSGTITEERGRDGKTVTGRTQSFGSGTITRRSDGSSSRTQPFGSGTLQRDQPGRKVGR